MSSERFIPEGHTVLLPEQSEEFRVHANARKFIAANRLKDRLSIGSKIPEGFMLEDSLAIEVASEQVSAVGSMIRKRRSGSLSKRRVLGAYTRFRIRQLEKRRTVLSEAFDYLREERKSHRDETCKTPQQLQSADIIMEAIDDLIVRAQQAGVTISSARKLRDEDLEDWQNKYRERLYAVGS